MSLKLAITVPLAPLPPGYLPSRLHAFLPLLLLWAITFRNLIKSLIFLSTSFVLRETNTLSLFLEDNLFPMWLITKVA